MQRMEDRKRARREQNLEALGMTAKARRRSRRQS
jgi:hypothetical protein